jgi:hypothetical protein
VLALRHPLQWDGDDGGAMAKRRPTIPIAHADDVPTIAITDEQWQAIEHAYGRQLNAEVRQQITTVTTQYLRDCAFDRTVAPKAMARERIELIRGAAGDLERVMLDREVLSASSDDTQQRQSAHSYADGLIRRHLAGSASSDELSSQQSDAHSYADGGRIRRYLDEQNLARDRLHHFRDALKSLIVACDCALNDLSAAEYCDDEPWAWWIQGLTRIAQEHHLPYGARIVETSGEPSPFVALVRALQEHAPARHTSVEALPKAIRRAQRRLDLIKPPRVTKGGGRRMTYALAFGMREYAKCYPKKSLEKIALHFGVSISAASGVIAGGKWTRSSNAIRSKTPRDK